MESNYNNECIHHLDRFTTFLKTKLDKLCNYIDVLKIFPKAFRPLKITYKCINTFYKKRWVSLHVCDLSCPQQTHNVNIHCPLLLILGFSNQTKIFIIVNNNNL